MEDSALLPPRSQRHEPNTAGLSSGYSSIERVEAATSELHDGGAAGDDGFREREYARLRRVVLFVTGLTSVLIGAALLVGLLVPATIPASADLDPDVTPALVILPVP